MSLAAAASIAVLALACAKRPEAEAAPARALRVEVAGCAAVLTGPVCQLGAARSLRLWVDEADASAIAVRGDDAAVAFSSEAVRGGTRLSVTLAPGVRRLAVSARAKAANRGASAAAGDENAGAASFSIASSDPEPDGPLPRAEAHRAAGRLDEAEAIAAPIADAPSASADGAGRLVERRAALHAAGGRAASAILAPRLVLVSVAARGPDASPDAKALPEVLAHYVPVEPDPVVVGSTQWLSYDGLAKSELRSAFLAALPSLSERPPPFAKIRIALPDSSPEKPGDPPTLAQDVRFPHGLTRSVGSRSFSRARRSSAPRSRTSSSRAVRAASARSSRSRASRPSSGTRRRAAGSARAPSSLRPSTAPSRCSARRSPTRRSGSSST